MNLFICIALLLAGGPQGYICTTPGSILTYERRDAANPEKIWWNQTLEITGTKPLDDGTIEVDCTTTYKSVKVKAPVNGPVNSKTIMQKDGTVDTDTGEVAGIVAKRKFSIANFKVEAGVSSIPARLAPGDTLKNLHVKVSWAGIVCNLDLTEREVVRRETITVPAGTFDCIVVKEHDLERYPFNTRDRITYTWYALGYGSVKHDTYFPDGRMECTESLVSVTN